MASSFAMTSLPTNNCQTNDPNKSFHKGIESLRFPLDNSMQILFTGYFNGYGVEVRSLDEIGFLFHMGCFGKGSASRSRPTVVQNDGNTTIMRKRQFLKRNYWYKKFECAQKNDGDSFFKDVDDLLLKIANDSKKRLAKDVIDLVSTDDEDVEENESLNTSYDIHYDNFDKQNITVVVPNSDSEDENYFSNMKPKSCLNKVVVKEKLMLTLQEAFFLLYGLGCLQILKSDDVPLNVEQCWELFNQTELKFLEKYIVYHYFRSKGYIVKPGIKFGGDYLLYKEGPGVNHADYIVVINMGKKKYKWTSVLGHVRMANTTVKEVMLAEVKEPANYIVKLPDDLCKYTVREVILTRHLPITINSDDD